MKHNNAMQLAYIEDTLKLNAPKNEQQLVIEPVEPKKKSLLARTMHSLNYASSRFKNEFSQDIEAEKPLIEYAINYTKDLKDGLSKEIVVKEIPKGKYPNVIVDANKPLMCNVAAYNEKLTFHLFSTTLAALKKQKEWKNDKSISEDFRAKTFIPEGATIVGTLGALIATGIPEVMLLGAVAGAGLGVFRRVQAHKKSAKNLKKKNIIVPVENILAKRLALLSNSTVLTPTNFAQYLDVIADLDEQQEHIFTMGDSPYSQKIALYCKAYGNGKLSFYGKFKELTY